jgi:hypothetical protein
MHFSTLQTLDCGQSAVLNINLQSWQLLTLFVLSHGG